MTLTLGHFFMRKTLLKLIPAILWFFITFWLLTIPGKNLPDTGGWLDKLYADKLIHIALFAILTWLFFRPFAAKPGVVKRLILIAVAATAYGIVMEFVQKYWIPNRSFSLGDIAADSVGSFLPLLIFLWRPSLLSRPNIAA